MPVRDLTRPIAPRMWTYPGDPPVEVDSYATHGRDGYRVSALSLGTHTGTHVDAPAHVDPGGRTLGSFDVETFRFEARLADCRGLDPRTPIGVDDLTAAVSRSSSGAPGANALVIATGWSVHWGSESYLDHPYLTREAAAWCAGRGYHVAIDAPSVDPTPSARAGDEPDGVPAHHALLGRDRLIVENLAVLDDLPDQFTLRAYPLAVDADGAPVRAVAEW